MRRSAEWARGQFALARVARLATVGVDGAPALVPLVFALAGDLLYTAVDGKPKSGARLGRLVNIAAHPQVCLLVDHYADDWDQLWWARADGTARILTAAEAEPALDQLRRRYQQYRQVPLSGPVIAVTVQRWTGWSATSSGTA